ncbi:MAG: 50S ribosomal protein L11 methyltransferase [Pseudomonadota bacterium]
MNWLELLIELEADDCERVEAHLLDVGAQALTLRDAGDTPLLEPLPGETPVWPQVRLTALFNEHINTHEIEKSLTPVLPAAFIQWRTVKDQEWERVWLARFKPRQFGERLWVVPSGLTPPADNAVTVVLDPGLAFGTGDHATTALCLEWLDGTSLHGRRVLDYGHGSGILSIAAHKLGAQEVVGVDIDPQAIVAGNDNATRNHIATGVRFTDRDVNEQFDVLVANILARPLIDMAARLSRYVVSGGDIALSGLLADQSDEVQHAFAPWVDWQAPRELDEWALLRGVRNDRKAE